MDLQQKLEARGESIPFSGCTIWTGAVLPSGYGHLSHHSVRMYVHRLAWELANGPIPVGHIVCHTCDVPSCFNAKHLFVGTTKDNMLDRDAKGRGIPKTRVVRYCLTCADPFEIKASGLKRGRGSFCSRSCAMIERGRTKM